MKKIFFSCILFLFLMPSHGLAGQYVPGTLLGDSTIWNQFTVEVKNSEPMEILQDIVILPHSNYDSVEAVKMVRRLSRIDTSILDALSKRNAKMKLFTGELTDIPVFQHLKGVQPNGWHTGTTWDDVPGIGGAFVAAAKIGSSEPGKSHGSVNLELHEIAHTVDSLVLQYTSRKEAFEKIWDNEAANLFYNSYVLNDPKEYFAEAFAMYYLNDETNERLKEKAPETYHYIEKIEQALADKGK